MAADGWQTYRKVPKENEARPVTETETVETSHGPVQATPGDYVVRDDNGDVYPVSGDKFFDLYEPVEGEK